MSYKKWIVADADKEKASALSEKLNIDAVIAFLLVSRGVADELKAASFLSDATTYASPYSFKDMDKAVNEINCAIDAGQRICIYGDYDCDGVTSTSLLYLVFESLGADVFYYIPNRIEEGYGMNIGAIDKIKDKGADLIVTVDNGISAIEEAEYIYSLGMRLVVTDHHQIGDTLPRAEAVVNPHREDNDLRFRDFAGVGVAFKLACALCEAEVDEFLYEYADLVAIGTIGDVVPLRDENRGFVKKGLELINNYSRIGLEVLRKKASGSDSPLTAVDVAFLCCPRINAAGRMDKASTAVELLITEDYETASFKAEQLCDDNEYRHKTETKILEDIEQAVLKNPSLVEDRVIVIGAENYHKGVIGIVASHIVSRYGKPAIIISIDENGSATGSARSVEGFNIYEAIDSCRDMLSHFGGHPLAAGLGLAADDIDKFRERINEYAKAQYPIMPAQCLKLDMKISPFYLNTAFAQSLEALEPYGAENSQPIFGLFNMTLESITPIGDGKHIRFEISKKGKKIRVVKFRTTVDDFPFAVGDSIDVAVRVSNSFFKERLYLSVQAVDVRKSMIDEDKYFAQKLDYEQFRLGNPAQTQQYPDRAVCAMIYKYLKQNNGYKYTVDDLYFTLNQQVTYAQLCYALEAFEQAGLINRGKTITVNKVDFKVDLERTQVLATLKGRI